jgi:hypothetical protein
MTDVTDAQTEIVEAIKSSAEWRDSKAEQYPDDKRNTSSSRSLSNLAKKLGALRPDNQHLVAYAEVMTRAIDLDDALSRIIEFQSRYIGRYGFDYPQDGDPAAFLDALTEEYGHLIKDAEDKAAEEKRDEEYEAAKEAADEAAKEAADEAAKEAAEEAAKEAADEAYKEAYEETYKEVYDEAYKEALIEALQR